MGGISVPVSGNKPREPPWQNRSRPADDGPQGGRRPLLSGARSCSSALEQATGALPPWSPANFPRGADTVPHGAPPPCSSHAPPPARVRVQRCGWECCVSSSSLVYTAIAWRAQTSASQSERTAAIICESSGPYSSFTDRSDASAHEGVTSRNVPYRPVWAEHIPVCEMFFYISRT